MLKHMTAALVFFITATACAAPTAVPNLTRSFVSDDYHYSIQYPFTWQCHTSDRGTVVIENTLVSVNIQTLHTKKDGGTYATVKDLMNDFRRQVPRHTGRAHFLERQPYVLTQPKGESLNGEETTLTFRENGQTYKQWQIMLISADGLLFQAWAYRAPEKYFDANRPLAEAILASWVID